MRSSSGGIPGGGRLSWKWVISTFQSMMTSADARAAPRARQSAPEIRRMGCMLGRVMGSQVCIGLDGGGLGIGLAERRGAEEAYRPVAQGCSEDIPVGRETQQAHLLLVALRHP